MKRRGRPSELILFVDVNFFDHPKIATLTIGEREQWLRMLVEQLRSGNGAEVPRHAYGVSKKRLQRYADVGLLDNIEGVWHVHNWDSWNGRSAYRRFLTRNRVHRFRERKTGEL